MMQAMPYNLQGKGVVEVQGINISQISSKWKSLDNNSNNNNSNINNNSRFQQQQEELEEEEKEYSHSIISPSSNKRTAKTSVFSINNKSFSADSEPTSTLETTRRSPSSPTSTSTLASTDNAPGATTGVADPSCPPREDWSQDNAPGSGAAAGGGGGAGAGEMEEWDLGFPSGDGALLPWIMGEGDDYGVGGLKHLLQSGNPPSVVEYEGNAGLGVVDQGSALDSLSPHQISSSQGNVPVNIIPISGSGAGLGFPGPGFGNNGKIGSGVPLSVSVSSPNGSSGGLEGNKGGSNGMNPAGLVSGGGGLGFPQPQQFDVGDDKPQIFNPQLMLNHQQAQSMGNPSFLMPPLGFCQLEQHLFQPQAKRLNTGVGLDPNMIQVGKNPFLEPGHEMFLRKHQHQQQQQQHQLGLQQLPMGLGPQLIPQHLQSKPLMVPKQHYPMPVQQQQQQQQQLQEQAVKDQLFKAADLIQTGNFSLAQEILARLNHQLSLPAKPLVRAAFYVKEALQMLLLMSNPVAAPPPKTVTPYDIVHKMNAYKVLSEVSPVTQFVNFTCTQAILEALDDADTIHIIDFDIGCGAQWASLIQELPLRKRGAPSLKITALAPMSTSHPFEIGLIRENLVQFANDTGVAFELQVVNFDLFDPSSSSMPNLRTSEDESIAVSIPIWAASNRPSVLPSILRFIKQRSPKIVVSWDRGFDRCDVPFPQHLLHTLESNMNFLDSLDSLNVAPDIVSKVEKYFIQPRIENSVLGRVHAPDKMPHWKNLFASAGLTPVQFSNFTETQADYVVKRTPGRGFHVEKRQSSLVLSWQRRDLVAATAWRC